MKPSDQMEPTGINFWVQGIVSHRDKQPYVQLANGERMIAQLTIAQARTIAKDIVVSASYAEADAMLHRFFIARDLPMEALAALMMDFRDFRHALSMEKLVTGHSDPDTGEEVP